MTRDLTSYVSKMRKETGSFSIAHLTESIRNGKLQVDKEQLAEVLSDSRGSGACITPNAIADLISKIGSLFHPKTVLDPACGLCNLLSRCSYAETLDGYDVNTELVELGSLLHKNLSLSAADFFQEESTEKYDLIVCDLPFGMRYQGKHADLLFVKKCLLQLKKEGVFICTVPNNFLSASYSQEVRASILRDYSLEMIVEIPRNTYPHTSILASVMVIKKAAQRKSVLLSPLKDADELIAEYRDGRGNIRVDIDNLAGRWTQSYHDPKHGVIASELEGKETRLLEEMAEVISGARVKSSNRQEAGKYLIYANRNIQENALKPTDNDKFVNDDDNVRFQKCILRDGDIVVNLMFDKRTYYIYKKSDPPTVVLNSYAIIRSADNPYIQTYLSSRSGQKLFSEQANRELRGASQSYITIKDLKRIAIPILPLDDLNSVSFSNLAKSTMSDLDYIEEQIRSCEPKGVEFPKEMLECVKRIRNNTSEMMNRYTELQDRLQTIRENSHLEEDEKLELMYELIEPETEGIKLKYQNDISVYRESIKDSIDHWDKLDELSKDILPTAEYLLDKLRQVEDVDYAPVILQYCRALENEVLIKLFVAFTEWIAQEKEDLKEFLAQDLAINKTKPFATSIKKYAGKAPSEMKYTLGFMHRVLEYVAGKNTISKSPLLQEFKKFIDSEFKQEMLLSEEYLGRIELVLDEYRNKCAHPSKLDESTAIACRNILPADIDDFVISWLVA